MLTDRPDLADRLPAATGLDPATLTAIAAQAEAIRTWLRREGYPTLHLELPLQVTRPDGSQTNAIIDCLAEGPQGFLILDHKSGPAPDPATRFAGYRPQLLAYAEAVTAAMPNRPVRALAVNWMNEGALSFLPLEPETVA